MMEARTLRLDPFIIVLDERGRVLASDDDSGGGILDAEVANLELPADGLYLVLATAFSSVYQNGFIGIDENNNSTTTPRYAITVSGNTAPSALAEATPRVEGATLAFNETVRERISVEQPAFFFYLDAQRGDVVTVTLESSDFDTVLYIFDGAGQRIAVNDDAGTLNKSQVEALRLRQAEPYLVVVTVFGFQELVDPEQWNGEGGRFIIEATKGN